MDNILSSLERLSELSEDELKSLKESVFTEYKSVKPKDETSYTVEVVDTLNQLADAKDAINAELAQRAEAASQLAAAAEAATSRLDEAEEEPAAEEAVESEEAPAEEAAPADDSEEEKKEEDEEDEDKKVGEFATDVPKSSFGSEGGNEPQGAEQGAVEAPQEHDAVEVATDPTAKMPYGDVTEDSVAEAKASHDVEDEKSDEDHPQSTKSHAKLAFASDEEVTTESSEETVSTENLNSFSAPEENAPVVEAVKPVKTITASADFDRVTAGTQLTSLSQVAQGIVTKRHSIANGVGADNEYIRVASIETEFSADRTLGYNDAEGNKAKIDAALAEVKEQQALVAAGGLTAPVETSYDIFELGETDARPVRDSLPKFNAQRGGIRFLTSPIIDDLNGAVSVWTLQNDIDAASDAAPNPVKPCLRVQAGEEVTVVVDAIPLCLTFGNLQTRAYPELVERHIKLGMVWHARFAEQRLLTRIGQLSTNIAATATLGAARDILSQVEVAAAAYRNRYRISSDTALRVMFPEWFRNALRSDLLKQLPGDGRDGTFNLGEAEINSWFATRNINVTWFIDGEAGQVFGAQADATVDGTTGAVTPADLLAFPETLVWYLFSEGTFLFLDAGTLDLGLVRDSTLNGTNDYKIFLETFEGLAKVGQESLRISSALAITGASSGTVAVPVTNSI